MVELRVLQKRKASVIKDAKVRREPNIHQALQKMKEWIIGKPWISMRVNNEMASFTFGGASAEIKFPEGSISGFDVNYRKKESVRNKTVRFPGKGWDNEIEPTLTATPEQEIEVILDNKQRCTSMMVRDTPQRFLRASTEGMAFVDVPFNQTTIYSSDIPTSLVLTVGNETTVFEIKPSTSLP